MHWELIKLLGTYRVSSCDLIIRIVGVSPRLKIYIVWTFIISQNPPKRAVHGACAHREVTTIGDICWLSRRRLIISYRQQRQMFVNSENSYKHFHGGNGKETFGI